MRAIGWSAFVACVAVAACAAAQEPRKKLVTDEVRQGERLVTLMACDDCHTPWTMGPTGPAPDKRRRLSGHPADMKLPPPPKPVGPWVIAATGTNTAWAGPWGISYAMNLTPDPDTGLGGWTKETFVKALRTGRHAGSGRPILPPMPLTTFEALVDDDIGAIWAYLRTLPPIRNRVPDAKVAPPPPRGK